MASNPKARAHPVAEEIERLDISRVPIAAALVEDPAAC
jgi:hypothetical protein